MGKKIVIAGPKVHGVGYRSLILFEAVRLGIDRLWVANVSEEGRQAVLVTVDGPEDAVSSLVDFVRRERPERAVVEEVRVEDYEGPVPPIERTINLFQLEQWTKGIPLLLEIAENTRLIPEIAENMREAVRRLDRIERILERLARAEERIARLEEEVAEIREALRRAGIA